MKKVIIYYIFFLSILIAGDINREINNVNLFYQQKEIFNNQLKNNNIFNLYIPIKKNFIKNSLKHQKCIKITDIKIENVKLIKKSILKKIIKPYINKCDTINDIKNLLKKINNLYLKKAYITSLAYIKPQNLKSGILVINVIEGKINKIKAINTYKGLVFLGYENNYLNLRELENSIEQLNRLHSIKTTMKLVPAKKKGYTDVYLIGHKKGSVFYGNVGVNNFGLEKTGKFQISGTVFWENPIHINDKLSLSVNTTNKQEKNTNSLGSSISYGFPVNRFYLESGFSYFRYKQILNGLNKNYESNGNSRSYYLSSEYNLFHNKSQKGKINIKFLRKINKNYLSGVYLSSSSAKETVLQLGYTHYFLGKSYDAYVNVTYHKSVIFFRDEKEPTFYKFTTDMGFNKKWKKRTFFITYDSSLHAQYAPKDIISTEQIGVGGIYSVRGFKTEGQLSGNEGFYIRNNISFTKSIKKKYLSPYIGLDYGYVDKNKYSYGGEIVGGAIGIKFGWKNFDADIFETIPIWDSNKITYNQNGEKVVHHDKRFFGINIKYQF